MELQLEKILERLNEIPAEKEKWNKERLEEIYSYYKANNRYYYYEITKYIIEIFKEPKDMESTAVISGNIKELMCSLKIEDACRAKVAVWECKQEHVLNCNYKSADQDEMECSEKKKLYRFLFKLYDHIQLESVRLSHITDRTGIIKKEYENIKEQMHREREEYTKEIEKDSQELKAGLKNVYLQIVSILGIFSAITIAVFGGMQFLSAPLKGIKSIEEQVFIVSTDMFFVFNVIFVLLWFVSKINNVSGSLKNMKAIFAIVNLACILGIIFSVCASK